jgi:hypothetical protein
MDMGQGLVVSVDSTVCLLRFRIIAEDFLAGLIGHLDEIASSEVYPHEDIGGGSITCCSPPGFCLPHL